ncbi:hypothetical protein RYX36_033587 [Vicia faba]
MGKKRKSSATCLYKVDRTMYDSFCTTENSISQVYTHSMNHQKLSFHADERNTLQNFIGGFGRKKEGGSRVIEFCKKHIDVVTADKPSEDELKAWDAEFVKVDQVTLFELTLAVNYLNIKNLLDLACRTIADMIKGNTPVEIRMTFNIKNDFTPEEEEEVCCENQRDYEE